MTNCILTFGDDSCQLLICIMSRCHGTICLISEHLCMTHANGKRFQIYMVVMFPNLHKFNGVRLLSNNLPSYIVPSVIWCIYQRASTEALTRRPRASKKWKVARMRNRGRWSWCAYQRASTEALTRRPRVSKNEKLPECVIVCGDHDAPIKARQRKR
jgi:hypothetical protein